MVFFSYISLAFARMPRAEARGGMATGDRAVARRAKAGWLTLRKRLRCESAQFRLALPQMPRAEARGASLCYEF